MSDKPSLPTSSEKPLPTDSARWIPHLARFLRETEQTRAVMLQDDEKEISVATIGPVDVQELRNALQETLAAAKSTNAAEPSPVLPENIGVRSEAGKLFLEKPHGCDEIAQLWTWRQIPWPSLEAVRASDHDHEDEEWKSLALLAAACGGFGIFGFVFQQTGIGPAWLAPVMFLLSMIAGGWDAAKEALPNALRGKLDIHFLMLAVAVGASLIGAFSEGALLLFLFSTAGALEHFALYRTKKEINALFSLAPKSAIKIDPTTGEERPTPIEAILPGDLLLVRPGDAFPVDGTVTEGETAADESALTGEATPVEKRKGDMISSGTMNLWGVVRLLCTRPAKESSLQKIIDLIQNARAMRSPSQRLTDRFGPGYTVGILAAATLMFFVWWLLFDVPPFVNSGEGDSVEFSAFYRAMTLLVVASPCALVLSVPSGILAAIAWGARHGILFRGGAAIEQLAEIRVVAMDKTGTLTTGDLRVVSVESFPPGQEKEVAELAYTLEQSATHPIARAIVQYGKSQGLEPRNLTAFRNLTGKGVRADVDEKPCLLGRRELLEEGPLANWAASLPDPPQGLSEVWFIHGEVLGRLLLEDKIREESKSVLENLRSHGIHTVMLTGDRAGAADSVGKQLGLSEVRAGLSPQGKVLAVKELAAGYGKIAMVGDGINDAPCLAAADVAVAMGARGSDAALEQSDVVLMKDKIENFYEAFRLSKRAKAVIHQNVAISLGTIVVMVSAAVFGVVPIAIGVLAHEGSTVLVCLNSMRLLSGKTHIQKLP